MCEHRHASKRPICSTFVPCKMPGEQHNVRQGQHGPDHCTDLCSGILHSKEQEWNTHTQLAESHRSHWTKKRPGIKDCSTDVKFKNRQNSWGDRGQNSGCLWAGAGAGRGPSGGRKHPASEFECRLPGGYRCNMHPIQPWWFLHLNMSKSGLNTNS